MLLSPAQLLVGSVLLPALVARLLRAPLLQAERALARPSTTAWGTGEPAAVVHERARAAARHARRGDGDGRGDGIELEEMGEAIDGTPGAPNGARRAASGGDFDEYGNADGNVYDSANPMRYLA